MSLVGAAILPHNPLLVSSVGLQNQTDFKNTLNGIKKVLFFIESLNVDSIVIISAHNTILPGSFLINLCPEYNVNFNKFGDLNTNLVFRANTAAAYRLKESLETKLPVSLICELQLDYTFGVILNFLKEKNSQKSIIPIYSTGKKSNEQEIDFGEAIMNSLQKDNQKFFVIVSGDLSHQKTNEQILSTVSKEYDHLLIKYLKQNDFNQIESIPEEKIINSHQCIHNPLLILTGILRNLNFSTDIYSYENIHGVGLLTATIKL